MYHYVSNVIVLRANLLHTHHHTHKHRRMISHSQCKTHKGYVSLLGYSKTMELCSTLVIQTKYMCACVCVDHDRVHNVFLYWEIFSKLDFKQTWVHLMRCWSGVQVCDHKTGWRGFRANDIDALNCFVEVSSWRGDEWFRSPVMLKMRVITGIPAILAFQCDSAKNLNPKDWIGFMYTVTYSPHLHFYFSFHVFQ